MLRRTTAATHQGPVVTYPTLSARRAGIYTGIARAFGTTISVSVVHADSYQAEVAVHGALNAAIAIDRMMSDYHINSQVFRLNRDGVLERPDQHVLALLVHADWISRLTKGAFDITIQPLLRAYDDAFAGLPTPEERAQANAVVGWRQVAFDHESVRLAQPGMAVTLGALATGYAADMAMAALRTNGMTHARVDTGVVITTGHNDDGRPWTHDVRDPREVGQLAATLHLDGRAIATAGDYDNPFSPDCAHHSIIDPATGCSPLDLASVTVVAPTAVMADGLATAFMVLGAPKAHALAACTEGVDLMTINKRGVVWKSRGFSALA